MLGELAYFILKTELTMFQPTDIAIVNGARTPMGRYCGKLRDFTAMELAAVASKEAMRRSGVEP